MPGFSITNYEVPLFILLGYRDGSTKCLFCLVIVDNYVVESVVQIRFLQLLYRLFIVILYNVININSICISVRNKHHRP